MSKYYLMNHQHLIKRSVDMTQEDADLEDKYFKVSEEWVLLEKGVDCQRMPTGLGWNCLYKDNSITGLLKILYSVRKFIKQRRKVYRKLSIPCTHMLFIRICQRGVKYKTQKR